MNAIEYAVNQPITVDDFIDVLNRSTLGQRRPVDDKRCMQGMLDNSNLLVTAYHDGKLIGVARSVTDFHFCCYLSAPAAASYYPHIHFEHNAQAWILKPGATIA